MYKKENIAYDKKHIILNTLNNIVHEAEGYLHWNEYYTIFFNMN